MIFQRKAKINLLAPILDVPEVRAAMDWYIEKLGFEEVFYVEVPGISPYGSVTRDCFDIHFCQDEGRDVSVQTSGIHLRVDDIDRLHREFEKRGAYAPDFPRDLDAIREHPPEDKEYGMRDLILVDPFGYILVFGRPLD